MLKFQRGTENQDWILENGKLVKTKWYLPKKESASSYIISRFSLLSWIPFRKPGRITEKINGTSVLTPLSAYEDNPCVDIRQYWVPPGVDESVPTKRGLCFRPAKFAVFIIIGLTLKTNYLNVRISSPVMKRTTTWVNLNCYGVLLVNQRDMTVGGKEKKCDTRYLLLIRKNWSCLLDF